MIGIFNNKTTKTDLTLYNGEYILDNICLKAEVTEELNGEYSLDIIFALSDEVNKKAYDLMVNDSLIKIDEEYGTEYFRIAKVTRDRRKIEIFARHITIADTLSLFCEDVRPTGLNGNGAINWIFNNARGSNWLTVSSNITESKTAYYYHKTVYEALFTADNSFINTWGGEVYRRGFNLAINSRVGSDRGVTIRSGKNLKGFEEKSNLNTLVTSIYPVGFNGITIEEKYINSPLVNNYSKIYPLLVKFDDVKLQDENNTEGYPSLAEAQAELKRRANLMYTKDKVDILTSSYTVTFAELQKAEEYKQYSILEATWLGDTIGVYEEKLGINIQVRVTKRVYNVLKKKRISTELSNKDLNYKPPTLAQVVDKLNNIANSVDNTGILTEAKAQATALLKAGLKNSYVVFRENEILIMDTKDINTAVKVWRFNNSGLGYSKTGYYGEYGLAITQDGSIVADFMNTGLLKSLNGLSWIDLDSGTFNLGGKVSFDGATFNIDLSSKGLATNSSVDSKIGGVNTTIDNKISTVNTTINNKVGELSTKIDTEVAGINSTLEDSIEEVNTNIDNKISTVNTNYANLTATVNGLSSTVGSHTTSITGLNTNIATVQGIANSKAKIFTTTPTPPYNVGDLFVGGSSTNIMRCKTARATGSYLASEWEKADRYTDDTKANEVATSVSNLTSRVTTTENNYTSLTQNLEGFKTTVGSTYSTKTELTATNTNLGTRIDSKAKVFTSTPTVPYTVGDLWAQGTTGEIMRCKTSRATGSYTASEWEKAGKYTDDTKANAVESTVNALTTRVASTESSITQLNNNIALKVGAQEVTNAIANVKIGGANLLKGSNFLVVATKDNYADTNQQIVLADNTDLTQKFKNKTFVFSYYVHCTGERTNGTQANGMGSRFGFHCGITWTDSTGTLPNKSDYPFATYLTGSYENQRVIMTHTFNTPAGYDTIANFTISFQPYAKPNSEEIWKIGYPKLEEGNKATDYSPATEDIYGYINSVGSEQVSNFQTSLELTADSITNKVAETYATKTDTAEEFNKLATTLEQSSKDFNMKFESERTYTETVEGELQSFKNKVETNINFNANGITISKEGSPFASNFTDTKLSFTQDTNEVAYISNNKMFITDAEVSNSLIIGSFGFLPRQNGNLSIVWKEA